MKPRRSISTFLHHGTGINVQAIEPQRDDRVEFTLWFTIFFIPILPLSSWSGVYGGEVLDAIREEGHYFKDLVRINRGLLCHLQTFVRSLFVLVLAIAPSAYVIDRTSGRAATQAEMILVFASAVWPVLVVILLERQRRRLLSGKRA